MLTSIEKKGHVGVEARHSNRFRVSVNTGARSLVKFYLLYEELLQRRHGIYQYRVNINPHMKLRHFSIGISVTERRNITSIRLPELHEHQYKEHGASRNIEDAEILMSPTDPGKVAVNYYPDLKKLVNKLRSKKEPLQVIDRMRNNCLDFELIYYSLFSSTRWTDQTGGRFS